MGNTLVAETAHVAAEQSAILAQAREILSL